MKKTIMTLAIVLGLSVASFAQGGLFQRGATEENTGNRTSMPTLPGHNQDGNQDGGQSPLGSGIVALMGLGAAYLIGKKHED